MQAATTDEISDRGEKWLMGWEQQQTCLKLQSLKKNGKVKGTIYCLGYD